MNKTDEVYKELINKMLEIAGHDVRFDDVLKTDNWYQVYTMTKEQEDEVVKFGVDLFRKKLRYRKAMAEQQMQWFMLMWGLKLKKSTLDKNNLK